MKKLLCLLCCLLLALPAALGEEISIAGLMARQVSANTTLRFQLTAEAEGSAPYFADPAVWEMLKALLPGSTLEGSYIFSKAGVTLGNSQAQFSLARGERTTPLVTLSGRADRLLLDGLLLGDTALAFPRDTELFFSENNIAQNITLSKWFGALLRDAALSSNDAGAWPSLKLFLTRAGTQNDDWQAALDTLLLPYQTALSAWMQERIALTLQKRGDGTLGTVSVMHASLPECAAQAQALLAMFYQDDALRDRLREQMTQAQAEAYLEEGMLPLFSQALSALPDAGEAVLERRYDSAGEMDGFILSLPFAGGAQAVLSWLGGEYTLSLNLRGRSLVVSVSGTEATGYTGAFALETAQETVSGHYQLFTALGGVVRNEAETGRERRQTGTITLLVTPDAGSAFPSQSLTVSIDASAGATDSKAARWNADVEWKDLSGASALRLGLKTRTAAPIAQAEAPEQATDYSNLSGDERAALLQRAFDALFAVILPAQSAD